MVEVLDHAPPELDATARLLLIALAEKADDTSRRVIWARGDAPVELLCRRTGLTDKGLTKALGRLAELGLEARVSLGIDRRGRPQFTHTGRAREFQIPDVVGASARSRVLPPEAQHSGAPTGAAVAESGAPPGASPSPRGAPDPPSGAPVGAPKSLFPSVPRRARDWTTAAAALVARLGCDGESAAAALDAIAAAKNPDDLTAYTRRFSVEDVERWASKAQRPAQRRPRAASKLCEHNRPISATHEPGDTCCEEGMRIADRAGRTGAVS